MTDSDIPHVYGTPDPDNRQPPAEQGLRGEQAMPAPARTDLAHRETTPDGRTLTIEEQSGPAFAEVTGRADGKDPGAKDSGDADANGAAAAPGDPPARMQIVELPPGIGAAPEDDCISIQQLPDGTFLLNGSLLWVPGEDDIPESIALVATEPYRSYEDAEAAGLAWADECGVAVLHVSRSNGTAPLPDPAGG